MEQIDIKDGYSTLTIYRGTDKEMDLFEKFFIFSKYRTLYFNNPFNKDKDKADNLIKAFLFNNENGNARRILYREMLNSFCANKKNQERFRKIEFYKEKDGRVEYGFELLNAGITTKEFFCFDGMLFSPSALLYDEKTEKRFFYIPISIKSKEEIVYYLCSIAYQIRLMYSMFEKHYRNPFYKEDKVDIEVLLEVANENQNIISNELKTTFYQVFYDYDEEYDYEFSLKLKNLSLNTFEQIENEDRLTVYMYNDEYKKNYRETNNYAKFIDIVNKEERLFSQHPNFDKHKIYFLSKMDLRYYSDNYIKQIIDEGKKWAERLDINTLDYERLVGKNNIEDIKILFSTKNKEDNTITR